MIKLIGEVIFIMGEEEDYKTIDDSIEIEEIKIIEKKPPNDKIIAHFIANEEKES